MRFPFEFRPESPQAQLSELAWRLAEIGVEFALRKGSIVPLRDGLSGHEITRFGVVLMGGWSRPEEGFPWVVVADPGIRFMTPPWHASAPVAPRQPGGATDTATREAHRGQPSDGSSLLESRVSFFPTASAIDNDEPSGWNPPYGLPEDALANELGSSGLTLLGGAAWLTPRSVEGAPVPSHWEQWEQVEDAPPPDLGWARLPTSTDDHGPASE